MVRLGVVRQGTVRCGMARLGMAGMARLVGQVEARRGRLTKGG